jgi:hypothetical protein
MLNKKGTDKPIEIFIALFIILAIAMLMLRMFSDQLKDKTDELRKAEYKQKMESAKKDAESKCSDKCTETMSSGCDERSLAKYCIAKVPGGLDLNYDGDTEDYVDATNSEELMGKCESNIYCTEVKSCSECGKSLNVKKCTEIVCKFLISSGLDPETASLRAQEAFNFGDCLSEDTYLEKITSKETWDYRVLDFINCYCGGFSEACALIS